jgi:hypothetical protein
VDNTVCWYEDSRPRAQRVFCGTIDRNVITGQWMDLPGGREQNDGQLILRVESNSRIVKLRGSSPIDAATWTRESSPLPPISSGGGGPRSSRNNDWERVEGRTASDIAASDDGTAWIIGTDSTQGGHSIFRWSGASWTSVDGGAARIDVDGRGNAWIVNSDGYIFRRNRNRWERLPGTATDIGAGADGSVWIVGTNRVQGGYGIYRWNGTDWSPVDGSAVRIDVDDRGNPWVVNSDGKIYRRVGERWDLLPGAARDITVDGNDSAWVIGNETTQGGYSIHRWTGSDWTRIDGGGTQISAAGTRVWLVNSSGFVYTRGYGGRR